MPRSNGIYSPPPGTGGTPQTTISSAMFNAFVADIAADQNNARPVIAGGTGAATAAGALQNLAGGANGLHSLTGKDTPVDADELPLVDSASSWGLKQLTWANLKATLKAYLDTLYLSLAGGTVTGNLRLDGGIGIARDAPLVGGLYFHRPNGNPFIVFSGDADATGTPVDLAQIRAEQGNNVFRLTTSGLQDFVSFNLTTRLGTVAGDPTAALGIATKQYVDARQSVGISQTWQDVTGSRAVNTVYQNTSGRPIMVSVKANISGEPPIQVSADNSVWVEVGLVITSGRQGQTFVVPPNHYYRVNVASGTIQNWAELR